MNKLIRTKTRVKTNSAALLLGALLAFASLCALATEVYEFDNDADRERFQRFTYELRCPTCQSQNLAGSDALVSRDLKRELHRLITEGKTDQEIMAFMTSRYGDFILYKPAFQPNTWLLWLAPAGLLIIGLVVVLLVVVKKQKADQT